MPSRDDPCPCGSGKKFKRCCINKGFEWVEEPLTRQPQKRIPLTAEAKTLVENQLERFRQVHGREPRPDDKVFFDMPPADEVISHLTAAMEQAGADPAFVYAVRKTHRIVTEENQHLLTDAELQEWTDAVNEYRNDPQRTPGEKA